MIKNKRDLGGIRTSDGMMIRPGCLYRSGSLHQASPEDLEGISEVIDFRTGLEEEKMPDAVIQGITFRRIPIFNESAAGITREGTPAEVPDMVKLYRAMLTEDVYRAQLREILAVIFHHDFRTGGILWHCTAGKDRCGIVTALVLGALGVDRDGIMRDYLRSNEACISEGDEVYQKLIETGMSLANADAVRDAFLAKPEYLSAAFDAFDEMPLEIPDSGLFRKEVLTTLPGED